jgi:trehalose 6-phosphate phosphatase
VAFADLPGVFAPLLADPGTAGVFTDFDGTLAPIVDVPDQATPLPGVRGVLDDLSERLATVAVISGRPVAFIQRWLDGPRVVISGLYGLEMAIGDERLDHPRIGAWREAVDDVVAAAGADGPGEMFVENKGVSVTLHYREHPEAAPAVLAWARRQAERSGLELRSARMSVELHPPVGTDKGAVLATMASQLRSACFIGDDIGDLPAFAALDRLREEQGLSVAKVVVRSSELPAEVAAVADVVVEGPEAALALLEQLSRALARSSTQ